MQFHPCLSNQPTLLPREFRNLKIKIHLGTTPRCGTAHNIEWYMSWVLMHVTGFENNENWNDLFLKIEIATKYARRVPSMEFTLKYCFKCKKMTFKVKTIDVKIILEHVNSKQENPEFRFSNFEKRFQFFVVLNVKKKYFECNFNSKKFEKIVSKN